MAKVKLNKYFYLKQAVEQAIKAYSSFATFDFNEQGKYYCIDINKINPKYKKFIKEEFSNYVLAVNKHVC